MEDVCCTMVAGTAEPDPAERDSLLFLCHAHLSSVSTTSQCPFLLLLSTQVLTLVSTRMGVSWIGMGDGWISSPNIVSSGVTLELAIDSATRAKVLVVAGDSPRMT